MSIFGATKGRSDHFRLHEISAEFIEFAEPKVVAGKVAVSFRRIVRTAARNPGEGADHDLSGFNFWLSKLNEHNGNFIEAEMVKALLNSTEYRHRFDW